MRTPFSHFARTRRTPGNSQLLKRLSVPQAKATTSLTFNEIPLPQESAEIPQLFQTLADVPEEPAQKSKELDMDIIDQVFKQQQSGSLKILFNGQQHIQSLKIKTQTRRAPKQDGFPNTVYGVMEYIVFLEVEGSLSKALFLDMHLVQADDRKKLKLLNVEKMPFVSGQLIKIRFGTDCTFHKTKKKHKVEFHLFEQDSPEPICIATTRNTLTLIARKPNKNRSKKSGTKKTIGRKRKADKCPEEPMTKRQKTLSTFSRELEELFKVMNPLDAQVQKQGIDLLLKTLQN